MNNDDYSPHTHTANAIKKHSNTELSLSTAALNISSADRLSSSDLLGISWIFCYNLLLSQMH